MGQRRTNATTRLGLGTTVLLLFPIVYSGDGSFRVDTELAAPSIAQAAPVAPPRKIALLVAINHYPNLPSDKQLAGPVNGAVGLAQVLSSKYGFKDNDIHLLLSLADNESPPRTKAHVLPDRPTKVAIAKAYRDYLVDGARPGDILVFYFAGHGSTWDDPQEPSREARTLVTTDSRDLQGSGVDILTVELAGWVTESLERKPGSLTVILDSCHSGSRIRGMLVPLGIPPDRRESVRVNYRATIKRLGLPATKPGEGAEIPIALSYLTNDPKYVLLAAAREDQLAYDNPNEKITFFAQSLVSSLASALPTTTYRQIMSTVAAKVHGDLSSFNISQIPVMEGNEDMILFGTDIRDQRPYVVVQMGSGAQVTLNAGLAIGMTVGSRYDIYPSDDFLFRDPTRKRGELRITKVAVGDSTAELLSVGAGSSPQSGDHAIERFHAQSLASHIKFLSPNFPPMLIDSVKQELQATPFSFLYGDERSYDIALAEDPRRPGYAEVEVASGDALGVSYPFMDPRTPKALAAIIEKYARRRLVLALRNPPSALPFSVACHVVLFDKVSTTVPCTGPSPPGVPRSEHGGYVVLRALSPTEGDVISLSITNTAQDPEACPVYGAIIGVYFDGTIRVAEPPKRQDPRIKKNPWKDVQFRVEIPEPLMRDFRGGIVVFKILVSTEPLNAESFAQNGYFSVAASVRGSDRSRGAGCGSDWRTEDVVFWVDKVRH